MTRQKPTPAPDHAAAPPPGDAAARCDVRILRAFRRIVRGLDVHSRRLAAEYEVTAPQLACLTVVAAHGPMPASRIAERVSLSASTVVGILDRLEAKQLVRRVRDARDRRVVNVTATGGGRRLIESAPPPLQEHFTAALAQRSSREQASIARALERVAGLMEAGGEAP